MSEITREDVVSFVYREARLLDELEYETWLGLFTEDRLLPAPDPADPSTTVPSAWANRGWPRSVPSTPARFRSRFQSLLPCPW